MFIDMLHQPNKEQFDFTSLETGRLDSPLLLNIYLTKLIDGCYFSLSPFAIGTLRNKNGDYLQRRCQ